MAAQALLRLGLSLVGREVSREESKRECHTRPPLPDGKRLNGGWSGAHSYLGCSGMIRITVSRRHSTQLGGSGTIELDRLPQVPVVVCV